MECKKELRRTLREKRRNLSADIREQAAQAICDFVSPLTVFEKSRHVGVYLASDGEINPHRLVELAWQQGKSCYLPIIDSKGENLMKFVHYTPDTEFFLNRYNIPEPVHEPEDLLDASILDLVLTPLVGFDNQGNRMGMGKGFYDRTFEFARETKKPFLMGLAHHCQEVDYLEPAEWDVPLNGLATEEQLLLF
ncbi:MAG: 5-formyltetrahydrofolate cyclo-ligase [Pseudomonadales bacterium]|jgi:5-formyltetrahydrofolate cyclo-ligase